MDEEQRALRETKHLYRRLDGLLGSILVGPGAESLAESFVERLLDHFSADLKLRSAVVYDERRSTFVRQRVLGSEFDLAPQALDPTTPGVMLALDQRVLLLEAAVPLGFPGDLTSLGPCATIALEEPRQRHLVLFRFEPGWPREDVEFALNTARSALNARLLEQRWGGTLREAAAIQQSLLPGHAPTLRDFDIAGSSRAAEEVGGDFFDFLSLDDDTLGLSIGDASGHGLPAALVARDVVVALRMGVERELKIRHTLRKLNRVVHLSNLTSAFVSLLYGELETNGNLFYVNAGHEPGLLLHASGGEWLARGGPVLGPLPDAEFKSHFVHVDRGATLVLYTDGIIERRNRDGEFFGLERLRASVVPALEHPARAIVEELFESADSFGAGTPWEDDATVVVAKRLLALED